jgi:hypothetical protein
MDYVLSYTWKSERAFQRCPQNDGSFEHWFWPYPFTKTASKLVEVPYLGMEHQSLDYVLINIWKDTLGRVRVRQGLKWILSSFTNLVTSVYNNITYTLPICGFTKDSRITWKSIHRIPRRQSCRTRVHHWLSPQYCEWPPDNWWRC